MILSFSFYTEELALRATPSQGFVTRNQRRRRKGKKQETERKKERGFYPLSGTSYKVLSASLVSEVLAVRTEQTQAVGVVAALRLCANLHWK